MATPARPHGRHAADNRAVVVRGVVSLFILAVGAAVGLLSWQHATAREAAERAALVERRRALRAELVQERALTEETARALLGRIEATRADWEGADFALMIHAQEEQARRVVARAETDRTLTGDVTALERDVITGGRDAAAWRLLHDRSTALHQRATEASDELRARIDKTAGQIDGAWFDALVARGTAPDAPAPEAAATLVEAVDLAEDRLADVRGHAAESPWGPRVHALVPLFDAMQRRRWTPAAVAAVAWQELPLREEEWIASAGGNLTRRVVDGALALTCAADGKARGGAVILRSRTWHDASVACDVRLERGAVVLLPRVHRKFVEHDAGGILLATAPEKDAIVVPASETVHVEATVVGDRVIADVGSHAAGPVELRIRTDERRGSLGLIVRADTVLSIRDVRIRWLD